MEKWKRGERAAGHLRRVERSYNVLIGELRADEPSMAADSTHPEAAAATPPPQVATAAPPPTSHRVVVTAHLPMPYKARAVIEAAAPMRVDRTVVGAVALPSLEKRKRSPRVCTLCTRFGTQIEKAAASQDLTKHDA